MLAIGNPPAPRPEVAALPHYRPGRSAADAMAEHGVAAAVKLASNEMPWPLLPSVVDALVAAAADANRYPDARSAALRQRLAALCGIPVEQVTCSAGASGLLQQLSLSYVGPGDEVVRGEPSFEGYPIYTRQVGGVDVAVPAVDWTLDLPAMAAAVTDRTRMVVVANPNNPTSTSVGRAAVRRLIDDVPPTCLVVLDGAYQEMMGEEGGDDIELATTRPNVVALRTFSKAYGLAGLRVGYAIAHPEVVATLDKVLLPFVVSSVAQAAALACLDAGAELGQRRRSVIAERDRVQAQLRADGWALPASDANFVWLPGADAAALAPWLETTGVVTRPFPGVGLRVSIGDRESNDRFLQALAGRQRER